MMDLFSPGEGVFCGCFPNQRETETENIMYMSRTRIVDLWLVGDSVFLKVRKGRQDEISII